MNLTLAWHLAWRSLLRHKTVSLATILGVTLGMVVIAAILIVDANSNEEAVFASHSVQVAGLPDTLTESSSTTRVLRIYFERGAKRLDLSVLPIPTQKGGAREGLTTAAPPARRGEEDYQAMRLAVRLAALMAFAVGAVIVFYTMRFSVASRGRELALLRCLGEERKNLALSLFLEALLLGAVGTLLGLLMAFPVAGALIHAGISTTGRVPSPQFIIPWGDLSIIGLLGVGIAALGVIGPIRSLYGQRIIDVLQPRFMSPDLDRNELHLSGFTWLIPPLAIGGWLAARPFIQSWLSVVEFFLLEILIVGVIAMATLWWVRPLLRLVISATEAGLKRFLPLDALLVGRRMRLTSHKLVFTVAAVTLVFSLLTALHDITRSLKNEIHRWAVEALYPFVYFERNRAVHWDEARLQKVLSKHGLDLYRLSKKTSGEFPARIIQASDINPARETAGKPPLTPDGFIVSRTLAARFDIEIGHRLVVDAGTQIYRFELIDITDEIGFYSENGQYVDLKSYLLFSDGHPLFLSLEQSLGDYAVVRKRNGRYLSWREAQAISPHYSYVRRGAQMGIWQTREIDQDFLIFDFVLLMTILLAAIGVANSILIQVYAREREFAVLRTLGISRLQTVRLLLVEGAIIGTVGALLALVLGNTMGAISVAFLDRFTLFEYTFAFSAKATLGISLLTVLTCTLAAIYPGLVANRVSSAESLHYEQ